jgi:hypothetical protein
MTISRRLDKESNLRVQSENRFSVLNQKLDRVVDVFLLFAKNQSLPANVVSITFLREEAA